MSEKRAVTLSLQDWNYVLSVLNSTPLPYNQTHPIISNIVRQLTTVQGTEGTRMYEEAKRVQSATLKSSNQPSDQ